MNLLLHICCGNCAVVPVKTLRDEGHNLTGLWFNPNIQPYQEYELRLGSLKGLSERWHFDMIYTDEYKPQDFFNVLSLPYSPDNPPIPPLLKGGKERCKYCYALRLEKTAQEAVKNGFDAFTTTLLISPYQDFDQITADGKALAERYNVQFLLADFRPHFKRAMAIAKELGLYRQKYCGCIFSRKERDLKIKSQKSKIKIVEQKIN